MDRALPIYSYKHKELIMPYPQERHSKTVEITEILDKDFNVVGKIMDSGKVESEVKTLSDITAESVYEAQEKGVGNGF